jgi:hypothetical protein
MDLDEMSNLYRDLRTFHRCLLPSFGSFGQGVSEEKIFTNLYRDNCILNTDTMYLYLNKKKKTGG